MRRPLAGNAEVTGRIDQAGAEVAFPDAVDDDPGRDRLLQDRLSQLEPAAALREWSRCAVAQHRQKMSRRLVAEIVRAAALADAEVDRLLGVRHAMDERELRRLLLAQRLDLLAQSVDVAPPVGAQLPFESPSAKGEKTRLQLVELLRRIEAFFEVALEDVGPEILAFDRQALQRQAAVGTEVVVGDEIA